MIGFLKKLWHAPELGRLLWSLSNLENEKRHEEALKKLNQYEVFSAKAYSRPNLTDVNMRLMKARILQKLERHEACIEACREALDLLGEVKSLNSDEVRYLNAYTYWIMCIGCSELAIEPDSVKPPIDRVKEIDLKKVRRIIKRSNPLTIHPEYSERDFYYWFEGKQKRRA